MISNILRDLRVVNLRAVNLQVGYMYVMSGSCSGLMVSELDSGSKGPVSSPGWVIVLCSWARHFTLTVPLSTHERGTRKQSGNIGYQKTVRVTLRNAGGYL